MTALKLNKTAFLTVVYPIDEEVLESFLCSLEDQTYKLFDVVVVNDGHATFDKVIKLHSNLNIREISGQNNFSKNREIGINFCVDEQYDNIVFGDCDDYFQNNRVEVLLQYIGDFDVVVNDLDLFNKDGPILSKYISTRLSNGDNIYYEFIVDKNIFGFSNTALSLSDFSKIEIPAEAFPPDWYFFKRLLKDGKKAVFTNLTTTFYRQHDNNLLGLNHNGDKYLLWLEEDDEN